MKLHFRKYGHGHPLFILHGIFGSSDNWQTVGKRLAEQYTVYLIDQRNHGNSPHDDQMNYKVMAEDLKELMDDEQLNSIFLLGHSMGGKTAMHFATSYPQNVDKLIVVDISPRYYPPHHQEILDGYRSLDLKTLESRSDADKQMAEKISNVGVRQFILKNLTRDDSNNFSWKINLDALENNIENIGAALPEDSVFEKATLFIGGSKSDYIQQSDHELIHKHFPEAKVVMIKDAGHWVHAEKPDELTETVEAFFSN